MAYQAINLGTGPDTGTGEGLRLGGIKINANFVELYSYLFRTPMAFTLPAAIIDETHLNKLLLNTNTGVTNWSIQSLATEASGVMIIVNDGPGSTLNLIDGSATVLGDLSLSYLDVALVVYTDNTSAISGIISGGSEGGLAAKGIITSDTNSGQGIYSIDASGGAFNWSLPTATGSQDRYIINAFDVETNPSSIEAGAGSLNGVVGGSQPLTSNNATYMALDVGAGEWKLFNLTGAADNLGNHIATQTLSMQGQAISQRAIPILTQTVDFTIDGTVSGARMLYTAVADANITVDADVTTVAGAGAEVIVENASVNATLTLLGSAGLTGGLTGDLTLGPGETLITRWTADGLSAKSLKYSSAIGAFDSVSAAVGDTVTPGTEKFLVITFDADTADVYATGTTAGPFDASSLTLADGQVDGQIIQIQRVGAFIPQITATMAGTPPTGVEILLNKEFARLQWVTATSQYRDITNEHANVGSGSGVVDSVLTDGGTNAVEGGVIKTYIDGLVAAGVDYKSETLTATTPGQSAYTLAVPVVDTDSFNLIINGAPGQIPAVDYFVAGTSLTLVPAIAGLIVIGDILHTTYI